MIGKYADIDRCIHGLLGYCNITNEVCERSIYDECPIEDERRERARNGCVLTIQSFASRLRTEHGYTDEQLKEILGV